MEEVGKLWNGARMSLRKLPPRKTGGSERDRLGGVYQKNKTVFPGLSRHAGLTTLSHHRMLLFSALVASHWGASSPGVPISTVDGMLQGWGLRRWSGLGQEGSSCDRLRMEVKLPLAEHSPSETAQLGRFEPGRGWGGNRRGPGASVWSGGPFWRAAAGFPLFRACLVPGLDAQVLHTPVTQLT